MKTSELKNICEDHVNDLITAIAETKDTKRFLDYLNFCASFHRYSFRNRILIWCYQPDATFVAGYKAWPKLGRHVKKGGTGIPIFAPMTMGIALVIPRAPPPTSPTTSEVTVEDD